MQQRVQCFITLRCITFCRVGTCIILCWDGGGREIDFLGKHFQTIRASSDGVPLLPLYPRDV